MHDPSDSTADQLSKIEELKERLRNGKKRRTAAINQLRQCAEKAAQNTPADSSIFYSPKPENGSESPGASGVTLLPDAEQVKIRKKQLIEGRKKSREVLGRLKRTSFQIVQKLRPTEFLDPAEVRRRLAADPEEAPAPADARISGNGAVGA